MDRFSRLKTVCLILYHLVPLYAEHRITDLPCLHNFVARSCRVARGLALRNSTETAHEVGETRQQTSAAVTQKCRKHGLPLSMQIHCRSCAGQPVPVHIKSNLYEPDCENTISSTLSLLILSSSCVCVCVYIVHHTY